MWTSTYNTPFKFLYQNKIPDKVLLVICSGTSIDRYKTSFNPAWNLHLNLSIPLRKGRRSRNVSLKSSKTEFQSYVAEKSDIPEIDKRKYLVPADLTVGQFVYVIRKRIMLPPEKAIFIFVNDTLPPTAALMSAIYQDHKDKDGFLYVTYSGENTFGSI